MNTLVVFWSVQFAALGLVVLAARRSNAGRKGLLLLLSALPFVLCILWGEHFKVTPGAPGADPDSFIAGAPLDLAIASIPISLCLIWILKGARRIAAIVCTLEVASAFLTALLATMQVTGSWI